MAEYIKREDVLRWDEDYIRRGDAFNVLCRYCIHDDCSDGKGLQNRDKCQEGHSMLMIPAADVRENIHAKWLHVQLPLPLSDGSKPCIQCSNCLTHWDEDCEFRYCPNCGAEMCIMDE